MVEILSKEGNIETRDIVVLLQDRFSRDQLHTRIGFTNLIAVNPYKRTFVPAHSDYDLENICREDKPPAPHPFDLASAAYLHMVRAVEDQVILTCGESGSGKTEILRQILQQIVHLSQQTDPQTKIHCDILSTEMVLECFGNAETLQNKNSTRYSRYTELRFNDYGTIVGSKIVDYLFEDTRVSRCPEEDHNFHIFYMMLLTSTKEERSKWLLHSPDIKSYHFLKGDKSSSPELPKIETLKASLKALGFSRRNTNEIFLTLAGILHLGNIEFTMEDQGKGYGAYVKNRTVLEAAAKLFSVSADALEAAITTASYIEDDIICSAFLDVNKSKEARNSLASVIYHLTFKWIIEQINTHLGSSRIGGSFVSQIGLLDIAGFEDRSPNPNAFDQFLSNYANEKLQTFVLKRAINFIPFAVAADGVETVGCSHPLPVDTDIIDFYDDPKAGMFEIIDHETYKNGENAKDSAVLARFEITFGFGKSKFYESGSGGWSTFKIKHYTGKSVSYNVNGFVGKNRNNCYTDVINLFGITLSSTTGKQKPKTFISGLFTESVVKAVMHPKDGTTMVSARPAAPQGPSQSSEGSRKKSGSMLLSAMSLQSTNSLKGPTKPKVSAETTTSALSCLKASIDTLIDAINEMRSWTIICVNPNDHMLADRFDFKKVLDQMEAYKVKEIAMASKVDYTVGIEFVDFMERFGKVHADITVSEQEDYEKCQQIIKAENWKPVEAQCGNSRVFLTELIWRYLESRIDKMSNEMDESEGRKIHLVTDSKGVARTPGFIQKSMGSLDGIDEVAPKAGATAEQLDIKVDGDFTDIDKLKSKSKKSLHKKEEEEDEEEAAEKLAAKKQRKCCGRVKEAVVQERMSPSRRNWVYFTLFVTWWIPDIAIEVIGKMPQASVRQAWREKCALCFIVLLLSGVMIFFVQGLGKLLCPLQNFFTVEELGAHNQYSGLNIFVSYNGYIFDYTRFAHPGEALIADIGGHDVSRYFPRFNPETGAPFSPSCDFLTVINPPVVSLEGRDEFIEERDGSTTSSTPQLPNIEYTVFSNETSHSICKEPDIPQHTGFCHDTITINNEMVKNRYPGLAQVGVLAFPKTDLPKHSTVDDWWTSINGRVYNISILTKSNPMYSFDPTVLDLEWLGPPGSDASKNATQLAKAVKCFDQLLLIGFIDTRASSAGCNASAYILYSVTGVMVAVMVVKFLAALQLAPSPNPEGNDRFVILQVPCYNEGESSLVKTIESLSTFDYDDTRKLLFIVSDGMVKSAGSDLSTPDMVLQILGVDKKVQQPEAESYLAIGRGLKEHNKAKVYSGLYSIQGRYIPFIVVMKVGKEGETAKAGNRGKRDSQMILMKFLNRVHFGTPMSPLELEMHHHIKNIIGVDPYLYEYCLMVDADTRVEAGSLNRLISCMVNDANTMGICGETRIENENESWVTMMQVYEYYISHHMAKAFESLFGSVTCLPGCFCMYRLRTPKKVPLLISNQILNEYKDIKVDTLHKQNLLSLGEDRFLTTLMLKHFPEYRNKFTPDALCYTIVPDTFNMLLGQRRRWINSTIHNLFELIFLPTLCGCLCFSLRLVVFLDLFATLIMPASTAYLVYLIYASVQSQQAPVISLVMMASAYGLQAIIFLFKGQYQHIGWMVISILAMPCFSFYLPLYAYWHFDDFKWGNTRKGAAADTGAGHGSGTDDEELIPLDPSAVPLVTWEAYESSMLAKGDSMYKSKVESVAAINRVSSQAHHYPLPTCHEWIPASTAPNWNESLRMEVCNTLQLNLWMSVLFHEQVWLPNIHP
ncbi:chitin synthase-domain-containing protein [Obelidium mucronatum]|nr:chitin synthase-domain-containing protein [Obelidium mucronatum]